MTLIPFLLALLASPSPEQGSPWTSLRPGIELGTFECTLESPAPESRITIVRIDPELWDLTFVGNFGTSEVTQRMRQFFDVRLRGADVAISSEPIKQGE